MSKSGRLNPRFIFAAVVAALVTSLFVARPVQASECDDRSIAAKSVEDAAQSLWQHSDVVGFAYITTIDTAEREQQTVHMVSALKGPADTSLPYVPLRIGRIGRVAPGYERVHIGPYREALDDEVVFVTLVRTDAGYLIPMCSEHVLAKDRTAIIRRLTEIAKHAG